MTKIFAVFSLLLLFAVSCAQVTEIKVQGEGLLKKKDKDKMELITLGSGCFWCIEAVFSELKGVESAISGYSGGKLENPSYREVVNGTTGHAEVIQVEFNPSIISIEDILEVFWNTHDPTTLNRQGNDIGTQYRSAIFYHDDAQRETAENYKNQLDVSGVFSSKIVTEITPFSKFYEAENYHQDYFEQNAEQPYCSFLIKPKVEKFRKQFKDKLK